VRPERWAGKDTEIWEMKRVFGMLTGPKDLYGPFGIRDGAKEFVYRQVCETIGNKSYYQKLLP
jgi:hypothetical protein